MKKTPTANTIVSTVGANMCKDYKKDIFGNFAYEFELLPNILSFLL